MIILSSTHMSGDRYEQEYRKEAFDVKWQVTLGPNIMDFENKLVEYRWTTLKSTLLGRTVYII